MIKENSGSQMDEESAPHRKTYAQAVSGNAANLRGAGRSGVDAAGDRRRQPRASTAAVADAPHPLAVSRLRTLGNHVLSLDNVGTNGCYANSTLTMIENLKPLKGVLENHEKKDHLGPVGKEVCRLMHLPKGAQVSLKGLRSLVANTLRRLPGENIGQDYDGPRQHDAGEFLSTLIQCLLDELKDTETSGDAIKELLTGQLRVSRVCYNCEKKNCCTEEMDNPLTLKLDQKWDQWILEDLVNHSSLSAGSTEMEMNCSVCSPYQNVPHKETKEFERMPRILFLTVGRFLPRTVGDTVVTTKIKDPVEVSPNLRVGCTGDQSEEYSLSSYVSHLGEEAVSGHYNVTLRDPETGTFALCDDLNGFMQATHTGMALADMDTARKAYLFCFEKKATEMPQSPPRKRANSKSHEVYSPIVGHSLGGEGSCRGIKFLSVFMTFNTIIIHI